MIGTARDREIKTSKMMLQEDVEEGEKEEGLRELKRAQESSNILLGGLIDFGGLSAAIFAVPISAHANLLRQAK